MNHIFRFTYYRRIQLSFFVLILLPIIAVSVILLMMTRNAVMDKIRVANKAVLEVMAKDVTKTIDDLTYASNFFVQDQNALNQLRGFRNTRAIESFEDYRKQQEIKDFFGLVTAKTLNTDIKMFLVNPTGFTIPSSVTEHDSLVAFQQHWQTIHPLVDPDRPRELQWLALVEGEKDSEPSNYYAARVIRDPADQALLGVLYIGIPRTYFDKLFNQMDTGKFALFDSAGAVIAGDSSLGYQKDRRHADDVRSESKLTKNGWTIIYETPEREVTGEISRMFYAALLFVVPFFVLFFVVSLVFARRLHRPIQKLQSIAQQFGQGNRILRFHVKGKDEIAELGQTLNQMLDRIDQLIVDIEQEQEQKRVMELQALFAQIRPHFLINTLNSIKVSLYLNKDRYHGGQIDSLTSLLRAYLKMGEPATLRSECTLLGHYIDIMNMRNAMRLELKVRLEPELETFEVPKLLLQPLVENAIVHGFVEKTSDSRIEVSAAKRNGVIEIRVDDNGCGMPMEQLQEMNELLSVREADRQPSYKRVGLLNVVQRLTLTYGPSAAMYMEANEEGGVTVVLRLAESEE
ncbi:Sensor histidine kinase YesM [Paenibacillus sp. UNCCL117]|uniref:cache domain-containing sensor histidine kinase n=1 Tax=unclassified Paenibacillus TaxID=185978 RepID=UPI00088E687B|nr:MULTISPECIES: histidine kinase [unclassified Paenibacillus]SDC28023.1 Sensor histidine kinase YesM [Paenibacillus sp. cl123]SFW20460.1 Sensor histidine kinase YesM [Paenibacillus sp. UNCCL117]